MRYLMNSSHAHIRLPMSRPFRIQEAIQQWHDQDGVHAFTILPELLVLQVSRFMQTDRGRRPDRLFSYNAG